MSQKLGKKRKIPKAIREEEFYNLIKKIPNDEVDIKIAFLLAYGSGMRLAEVLRCDRTHLRGNNSIFIPESKYGVERIVPIPKGWREYFIKRLPLPLMRRTLQRKFRKYAADAKLPLHYTFHSLRHGFATRLLEHGMPINQVQLLMGHSNISTTSVYTKANPSDALKSYEELF